MTNYDDKHVRQWLVRSLQSYVYWSGFKRIHESGGRVHERVRQSDLKGMIRAHLPPNFRVEEESPYRKISPGDLSLEKWKCDLAVRYRRRDKVKGYVFHTRYAFELKFADARPREFDWDLYKLARLSRAKREIGQSCRAFLVILGTGAPPERFKYTGLRCSMRSPKMLDLRINYQTRGIFTAAPIGREDLAHYASLVEVTA